MSLLLTQQPVPFAWFEPSLGEHAAWLFDRRAAKSAGDDIVIPLLAQAAPTLTTWDQQYEFNAQRWLVKPRGGLDIVEGLLEQAAVTLTWLPDYETAQARLQGQWRRSGLESVDSIRALNPTIATFHDLGNQRLRPSQRAGLHPVEALLARVPTIADFHSVENPRRRPSQRTGLESVESLRAVVPTLGDFHDLGNQRRRPSLRAGLDSVETLQPQVVGLGDYFDLGGRTRRGAWVPAGAEQVFPLSALLVSLPPLVDFHDALSKRRGSQQAGLESIESIASVFPTLGNFHDLSNQRLRSSQRAGLESVQPLSALVVSLPPLVDFQEALSERRGSQRAGLDSIETPRAVVPTIADFHSVENPRRRPTQRAGLDSIEALRPLVVGLGDFFDLGGRARRGPWTAQGAEQVQPFSALVVSLPPLVDFHEALSKRRGSQRAGLDSIESIRALVPTLGDFHDLGNQRRRPSLRTGLDSIEALRAVVPTLADFHDLGNQRRRPSQRAGLDSVEALRALVVGLGDLFDPGLQHARRRFWGHTGLEPVTVLRPLAPPWESDGEDSGRFPARSKAYTGASTVEALKAISTALLAWTPVDVVEITTKRKIQRGDFTVESLRALIGAADFFPSAEAFPLRKRVQRTDFGMDPAPLRDRMGWVQTPEGPRPVRRLRADGTESLVPTLGRQADFLATGANDTARRRRVAYSPDFGESVKWLQPFIHTEDHPFPGRVGYGQFSWTADVHTAIDLGFDFDYAQPSRRPKARGASETSVVDVLGPQIQLGGVPQDDTYGTWPWHHQVVADTNGDALLEVGRNIRVIAAKILGQVTLVTGSGWASRMMSATANQFRQKNYSAAWWMEAEISSPEFHPLPLLMESACDTLVCTGTGALTVIVRFADGTTYTQALTTGASLWIVETNPVASLQVQGVGMITVLATSRSLLL